MKKTKNSLVKQIQAKTKIIAKERDELRKIYDDLHDVLGSLNEGLEQLEQAADILSQYL